MEQSQQRQSVARTSERTDGSQNGERLLTTKLYLPPPRPNAVLRPRLTEQLERGLNLGCKLILVSASAGFGKTALVSEWLRLRARGNEGPPLCASAWLSLDEADNDPTRFFTYLVAALQQLDKAIGQGLRLTPQLPPVESLVTVLVNDLALLSGPAVLVLDDYHLIRTPLIHDTLELLLSHQPPHLHLVITTREDPPLPLSRWRVRGHLVEIRQDELRFTPDEVSAFMRHTMGLPLQPTAIAALEARTEGWVAGLQLAAISMQGRDERSLAEFIEAFSGSHRYVIDYLVEEVIQQQPDDIRRFLRETAILGRLSGPLCDAVLSRGAGEQRGRGEKDSPPHLRTSAPLPGSGQAILERLEQSNLFLIPLDDERRWYRYHHLFAEFLRTELDTVQQARLHRRAVCWFEANGLFAEAIQHALAAGDVVEAGRLIALAAPEALRRGELATLTGWLQALPDEFVQANYELTIFKAWLLWLTGQGALAEDTIHSASAVMPKDAPRRIRGRLVSLLALLALGHQGDEGLQLAQEALSLIDEDDVFFRSITLLVIGEVRNYAGDSVGAAQVFEEILQLGQKLSDPFLMIGGAMNLAQQWNWQGKRRQSVALCHQIIDEWDDSNGRPFPLIGLVYYTLAEMEYYAHNLDLAQQYLDKGSLL